jgi:murein DD-endopeptidase MepM/ murein hydrolase activator NlpD
MAHLQALSGTVFRDREFFIHDGRQLRRFRLSASVQAFFCLVTAALIAWSAFAATQMFAQPVVEKVTVKPFAAQIAKLAAETDRKVRLVEARQIALAAALEDQDIDPETLKQLGFYPATAGNGARGGPFDSTNADPTFKQLFKSWKKLDNIASGAIAIPSDKPLKTAEFTSGFGSRSDPFRHGAAFHPGIDLAAPRGTPVYATADGTVRRAGWNSGGYGNLVELDHGRGILTRYGHMSKILVSEGDHVKRGQQIGEVGSTGRSTGNHLHYEVRIDNSPVNPIPFMRSTDYLLAMKRAGSNASMDQVALGGPAGGK